jgi:FkbM family methyltransferase
MSRVGRLLDRGRALVAKAYPARSRRYGRWLRVSPREDLVRIGSEYGGWAIPERALSPGAVCYCGGIGLDISFDLGVIERFGCTVHAFDPTPAAIRHATAAAAGSPRFNLHPVGLWSSDCTMEIFEPASGEEQYSVADRGRTGRSIEAEFRAIPSLMSELGHDHIDVLKLDIEGAEYEVIDSLIGNQIPVTVLCVEFHTTPSIEPMKHATSRLRQTGLEPVHQERGFDVTFARR